MQQPVGYMGVISLCSAPFLMGYVVTDGGVHRKLRLEDLTCGKPRQVQSMSGPPDAKLCMAVGPAEIMIRGP